MSHVFLPYVREIGWSSIRSQLWVQSGKHVFLLLRLLLSRLDSSLEAMCADVGIVITKQLILDSLIEILVYLVREEAFVAPPHVV